MMFMLGAMWMENIARHEPVQYRAIRSPPTQKNSHPKKNIKAASTWMMEASERERKFDCMFPMLF
jgi:hypothetical protein